MCVLSRLDLYDAKPAATLSVTIYAQQEWLPQHLAHVFSTVTPLANAKVASRARMGTKNARKQKRGRSEENGRWGR